MSLNDCSTFDQRRPFSNTSKVPEELGDVLYDFIHFLAVVQTLQVAFLPITWQSAREQIGRGGTSKIDEALMNLNTSFAFKRVARKDKLDVAESTIFKRLVDEIIVLSHPSIRAHPNIVDLEGVCWDIDSSLHDDKVWPVLVFEKSEYGDLNHFASLVIGRELGFQERLKLCLDIGTAIAHMHSNRIIHGDIKPHNVLIFKDNKGVFTAKVTDFGYSTCYSDHDELIALPKSPPWHAPEYTTEGVKPAQARKMDVFSLGSLFLWFIFEEYFCGIKPLSEEVNWATEYFNYEGQNRRQVDIDRLRQNEHLMRLAHHLLRAEDGITEEQRRGLGHFFSTSLTINPESRQSDIEGSLKWFNVTPALEGGRRAGGAGNGDAKKAVGSEASFYADQHGQLGINIPKSGTLEGGRRAGGASDGREKEVLGQEHPSTLTSMANSGSTYRNQGRWKEAEELEVQVMETRKRVLGQEHPDTLTNMANLASTFWKQGRWKEAEELEVEVVETSLRVLGLEHPSTLTSIANLASTYRDQGRWKEAEELDVQAMDIRKRVFGQEHPDTLTSMGNVGTTYRNEGRWKEATELEVEVMETRKRVLGQKHPDNESSYGKGFNGGLGAIRNDFLKFR